MTDKILATLVVLMLTVSPSSARAGDRVMARVGSIPITYMEIRAVQSENQGVPFDEALQLMIDQKLAFMWAQDNQVYVSNEEVEDILNSLRESNNLTE